MANIRLSDCPEHLTLRATERYPVTQAEAEKHLDRIIHILQNQAPQDWRFTRNPVGRFLVWDETSTFWVLGRSYRRGESYQGDDALLIEEIKGLEKFALNNKKLEKMTQAYLEMIHDPGAEIWHELKTVMKPGADISQAKQSFKRLVEEIPHVIPIRPKQRASRPNALINAKGELWVRQEEFPNPNDPKTEYLAFEKLTEKGIDKKVENLYLFDRKGNLSYTGQTVRGRRSIHLKREPLPEGFRTESYWCLPTVVDAHYVDILYKMERHAEGIVPEDLKLWYNLDRIVARAKDTLNKGKKSKNQLTSKVTSSGRKLAQLL